MTLKRNKEITIKTWINSAIITDENWEIFSEEEANALFIVARCPTTGNEMRLRIEKTQKEQTSQ